MMAVELFLYYLSVQIRQYNLLFIKLYPICRLPESNPTKWHVYMSITQEVNPTKLFIPLLIARETKLIKLYL